MNQGDQAVVEIAKLELDPSMIPSQDEVKEFVTKFASLAGKVDQFRHFSAKYSKKSNLEKWWDNDVARDTILSSVVVVGELGVLANKLLALNVVFAQRIDGQTTDLGTQGVRLKMTLSDIAELSDQVRAGSSVLNSVLVEQHLEIGELKGTLVQLKNERQNEIRNIRLALVGVVSVSLLSLGWQLVMYLR